MYTFASLYFMFCGPFIIYSLSFGLNLFHHKYATYKWIAAGTIHNLRHLYAWLFYSFIILVNYIICLYFYGDVF